MLLVAVGFGVAAARVVGDVLGHRLVRVQPQLGQTVLACPLLREREQPAADAVPLHGRVHRQVLDQQVIWPADQDDHPADSAALRGHPHLVLAHRPVVVRRHRHRRTADPGDVVRVRGDRERPQLTGILVHGPPQSEREGHASIIA